QRWHGPSGVVCQAIAGTLARLATAARRQVWPCGRRWPDGRWYGVLLLAVPAVVHHKPLQRRPPVGAILTVGPAERDNGGTLDMVGDAEDGVGLRLTTAGAGREHGAEAPGAGCQHGVLAAPGDRGAGLA